MTDLLERLRSGNVRELEIRQSGVRVKVSRVSPEGSWDGGPAPVAAGAAADALAAKSTPGAPRAAQAPSAVKAVEVTAPLTGIFYRSASPQAPPFVQVGSAVRPGDVVGLIEAMKLFNEVRSTVAGRVRKIVAENGQLVRAHQPLVELE